MTQSDFTNYKVWIKQGIGDIGSALATAEQLGDPKRLEYRWKLKFLVMYDEFLCDWQLETYHANEDGYIYNCIKPSEAECLAKFVNTILGISFCIDFYLTV